MNDRVYAGDVVLMLGLLATFGMAGAAVAVLITLCRHSPVIIGGIVDLAEYTTGSRPALLSSPRVAALLPGAAPVLDRPLRAAVAAPRAIPTSPPPAPGRRPTATLTPQQFAEDQLFRTLNEEPHRLVIGHTRGGKTTAMHGMAMAWATQGHPVYVIDPDAARGSWPGCEVSGYAEDYDGIGKTIETLRDVFDERSELYADGHRDFPPVHIVADEVHETIRNVPGARDFLFETVGRRGAKRGIFLTLGTQGNNVDELGLDSAGVLNNFITAELEKNERGRRVATVYRGNAAKKKRLQQFAVPPLPGASSFVQARPIRGAEQLAQVVARPAPAAEPEPDLLAELLARQADRERRLAAILAQQATPAELPPTAQSVTVERDGGQVTVNVVQTAPAAARRPRKKGGLTIEGRRLRLAYIEAARRGDKFDPTYKRLGGSRNQMWELFNAHKLS